MMSNYLYTYPEFKEAAKDQRAFEKKMRLSKKELIKLDNAIKKKIGKFYP